MHRLGKLFYFTTISWRASPLKDTQSIVEKERQGNHLGRRETNSNITSMHPILSLIKRARCRAGPGQSAASIWPWSPGAMGLEPQGYGPLLPTALPGTPAGGEKNPFTLPPTTPPPSRHYGPWRWLNHSVS